MARRTKAQSALRPGYVYVLATTYQRAGTPVIKIGMTTRTPDKRVAELSRGGPTGMVLIGFVTSRDAGALERMAHTKFGPTRVSGGGGTEYFASDPHEVLAWLRAETPRFELETAKQAAWYELIARSVQGQSNYGALCFGAGILGTIPGGIVGSFLHLPVCSLIGAALAFVAACVYSVPKALAQKRVHRLAMTELKVELEQRYNLPVGTLSSKRGKSDSTPAGATSSAVQTGKAVP